MTLTGPQKKRAIQLIVTFLLLAVAGGLIFTSLRDQVVFFMTPSDIVRKNPPLNRPMRVGGLVVMGSVHHTQTGAVTFVLTDQIHTIDVHYEGLLPDLFREGQGIVAEGYLTANGVFMATLVLAKHDETYMPKDVMERLQKEGLWKGAKTP